MEAGCFPHFGGRKEVGQGFGIPFILRYVLEFCSNVEEAVEALVRVPSHMSYNVTVLDKTGAFKTVQLAPDKAPMVTDADFTTNHQGKVDWPENALFNRTVERAAFLENWLSENEHDPEKLADAFLRRPLYNTHFAEGFGTLYTVDYRPVEGTVQLRWPQHAVLQSFDDFQEQYQLITFDQPLPAIAPKSVPALEQEMASVAQMQQPPINGKAVEQKGWQGDFPTNAEEQTSILKKEKHAKSLRQTILRRGQISWEILADYWANVGKKYWEKWRK
ncbi:MAG: carcinine hydrolase/isopenicillin-N N-acyltransferase family protein [Saprospiraceae bacterium]